MSGAREVPDGLLDMWSAHNGGSHPSPKSDRALDFRITSDVEVCGFSSLDALLEWFRTWLDVLDEAGFRLWVYEVPDEDARVGGLGQTCFRADSAEVVSVDRLPLKPEQLALFGPGDVLSGRE
ncbi:hypothetical protein [Streptomyces sp. bgisy032]|uniref:hypothetical protein n=1 Tax=Streptomyces sp. bgisy032 TaxID=3413773 RepID=UPI003D754934